MEDSFTRSVQDVAKSFDVHPENGLTDSQVLALRAKHGRNELPVEEGTPFWKLVLKQFDDQMVQVLLAAAAISLGLAFLEDAEDRTQAFVEPLVIACILVANAAVGVMQETNAEKAIEALKAYEPEVAVVVRNGKRVRVTAGEIVPGDVVDIAVGERIPADLRLTQIKSTMMRIDQSILTGESVSVPKSLEAIHDAGAVNQDKVNMAFSGTNVSSGKGRGIVVATGANTEMGRIREHMAAQEEVKTPLKQKLDDFGEMLSKVIMVICILVWIINVGHFNDPAHGGWVRGAVYYFKIAIALAVAAIPEGLPAVVTTCLALGTMRMARKNAIVRTLTSVETLGCTTVICSDKTGTLTTNMMSVLKVMVLGDVSKSGDISKLEWDVTGTTFSPYGEFLDANTGAEQSSPASCPALAELSCIATLCNDSSISYNANSDTFERMGEATEVALKVMSEKAGVPDSLDNSSFEDLSKEDRASAASKWWEERYVKEATLDFARDRKSMSVLVRDAQASASAPDAWKFLVKGAPEAVLERCSSVRLNSQPTSAVPLTPALKAEILETVSAYGTGKHTLRVLAFAVVDNAPSLDKCDFTDPNRFVDFEQNMTFVGLAGMLDPPRPEVRDSIHKCHTAGIRVIVITGDNKGTAEAICRRIGVFEEDEDLTGKSFTGREFNDLSDVEKESAIRSASLFCRVEPVHKSNLVDLLQKQAHVVSMTGDGVNDAPALKKADIGVAMGSGTAVAKGASDMVLADDNFATIVSAVEEGRAIYNNTKQFIRYLISSNIGEVVCIFLTAAVGMPEALIPVQLLWVNFVTDGLPATALGFNPADKDIMEQSPRGRGDPIINGWMFFRYMIIGLWIGIGTVGGFAYWYMYYEAGPQITWYQLTHFHNCGALGIDCDMFSLTNASTVSLSVLVTIEMFNALNSLSENQSIVSMPPWNNPLLIGAVILSFALHFVILYIPAIAAIFQVTPLIWDEWKIVIWWSAPVILIDELLKFAGRTIFNSSPLEASTGNKAKIQ